MPLFPDSEVFGLDYKADTPWAAGAEIRAAVETLKSEHKYQNIILIAVSIGAFFSMNAGIDSMISRAYFISPVVNMERLICDMMRLANVSEAELKSRGVIHTDIGEDLSWEYLCYVREHNVIWNVPTQILYGECDNITSFDTLNEFAEKHSAVITVMKRGEHWFHTDGQMRFLDAWIQNCEAKNNE